MKKWRLFLLASSLMAIVGVACAGIADRSDPPGAVPRHALLIANAGYIDDGAPLRHPIADARALTDELRGSGFDVVVATDLTKEAMQTAIADFTARIKPGSAALIFFSGHGIQVARQNYLIPVNAQIWSEADVHRDGIPLQSVLADMDRAGARVKLAVLDASRENPFERRFRDRCAGLVSVTPPEGTLIAYSATPDKVAGDGQGDNSPFVSELVKEVRSTGNTAEQVFMAAARSVSRASDGQQVPWFSSSLAEAFYFRERSLIDRAIAAARDTTPNLPSQLASAGKPPASQRLSDERATGEPQAGDRMGDVVAALQPAERGTMQEIPRLTFQGSRGLKGEPVPLGVTLHGRADGAVVTVAGLAPGMTLSAGYALGAGVWRVPAADLAKTWIGPPTDFVGAVDLVAEVHIAETLVHRRLLQFEWTPTPAAVAVALPPVGTQRQQPPATVTPPRQPIPQTRQVDREEIALLVKRGRDLMASGDVSAARLVLQRAAEARDADAAMALAATYDPAVLRQLKVYGLTGDVAMARTWYEKAREFGSAAASERLELLAKGAP
jgi:Caspase domain